MTLSIYEAFDLINKSDNPKETLKKFEYDSIFLKYLRIALGEGYQFSKDLPSGFPDGVRINRDFPDGISDTSLRSEHRGFYLYQDDKDLPANKRTHLFAGMLEGLHYTEADLVIAIKDGKFQDLFPNVTSELAHSVFPDLFTPRANLIEKLHDLNHAVEHLANVVNKVFVAPETIPETIQTPVEDVKPEVVVESTNDQKQTPVEPVKIDKRSRAYRESIGRK